MSDALTGTHGALRRNLLLLVVVTGVCLLFAEMALRVALPSGAGGWAAVPPLEDRVEVVTPKQPGEYRVLALGDSFTEYKDVGGDDGGSNWARVLEARAVAGGKGVTLYNFGQMGTGLPHYRKNLEDFGERVRPDLVVIGLYLGNDVLDYELAIEKEARGMPVPEPVTLGRGPSGVAAFVKQHSVLAGLLARVVSGLGSGPTTFDHNLAHAGEIYQVSAAELHKRVAAYDPTIVEMAKREEINPWDLAFGLVTPSRYADLLAVKAGSRVPAAIGRLLEDVTRVEAACDRLEATCAWLILPVGLQIDERYHGYFEKVGFETAAWMAQPTPLMAQLLPAMKAKGAFVIDALPPLQAAGEADLLLPNDTHLSDEGQRIVGEAAYKALLEAGAFEGRLRQGAPTVADDSAVRDPRLEALLKGSALEDASDEERRLALKIAALRKLRGEIQGILTSLPAQKAGAERMQAEVVQLEKGLEPAAVKRVLDDAAARLQREGPDEGSVLARAHGIDIELGRLLEKDPPGASDAGLIEALKAELAKEQHETAALGAGAAVAFRALRTLEQMKLALPELRKLQAAKGQ